MTADEAAPLELLPLHLLLLEVDPSKHLPLIIPYPLLMASYADIAVQKR